MRTVESKINSPEIIFGIDTDFNEHIGSLEEACNTDDLDAARDLLNGNKFVENIVIKKGNKNTEWLSLLERSIDAVAQEVAGKNVGDISDAVELERVIKSASLSPFAVAELAGALYHLKRDDTSEKLAGLLTQAEAAVIGKITQANAFNTLGCVYLRQGDIAGSSGAHKAGLTLLSEENLASDLNVQWQKSKLEYGVLIDKMEQKVFPDAPEQLFALRRQREKMGDIFNIGRVDLDVARAFAALNKKDQAIHYALQAKDQMSAVNYWTGAAQANELLDSLVKKKKKR